MKYSLSHRAKRALSKLGEIMIPGDEELPSFQEAGGIRQVDRFIQNVSPSDRKALDLVLSGLSLAPPFALERFLRTLEGSTEANYPGSSLFRQLNLAIRGLIFSCYYNETIGSPGNRPCDRIGYSPTRVEPEPAPSQSNAS